MEQCTCKLHVAWCARHLFFSLAWILLHHSGVPSGKCSWGRLREGVRTRPSQCCLLCSTACSAWVHDPVLQMMSWPHAQEEEENKSQSVVTLCYHSEQTSTPTRRGRCNSMVDVVGYDSVENKMTREGCAHLHLYCVCWLSFFCTIFGRLV